MLCCTVCVYQDLGCLFEIYLKPLEKETFLSRGEVSASHLTALLVFFPSVASLHIKKMNK